MAYKYDVVVIGGGHNGLVAAAYLAQAGKSVCVLEKNEEVGGAAVSSRPFDGIDVNLSRYAYLLSLFPQKIITDLHLNIQTRKRPIASYAPVRNDDVINGLFVSDTSVEYQRKTEASFQQITGGSVEYANYRRFNAMVDAFAEVVFPTLLQPLLSRDQMQAQCVAHSDMARAAWRYFVEEPLGNVIEGMFQNDTVRGTLFTDAKIGMLTHPHDPTLLQNRIFLYHILGTDWRVPVGGMGAVSAAIARAAVQAGATVKTRAVVEHIAKGASTFAVQFSEDDRVFVAEAPYVLANVSPHVLDTLVDDYKAPAVTNGAVFKVNMVLTRLPRLRDTNYTSTEALTGTFHFDEGYAAMQHSYEQVANRQLPERLPGEMYCHSLTDASIVGQRGLHTLTLFGLDMAYSLFEQENDRLRVDVLQRYLDGINHYFEEPLQDCLATDVHGEPCIEAHTPLDIEATLHMPGANIFHTELSWPFGDAGAWGVETNIDRLYICGSGAVRGGAVSGIPGHNAAQKLLRDSSFK